MSEFDLVGLLSQTSPEFDESSRRFHLGVMMVGFVVLCGSAFLLFRRPAAGASKSFLMAGGIIASLLAFIGFVIIMYGWMGYR